MKLLWVDDQLVDLYQTTVIAQTLQVFDPGRLGSVLTNYTSSIKVPRTRNNDVIFSFLANSKTKSNVPYASLSCRYEENGLPIIRNARIVLNEVNQEYSFTIYSGPWGFFETIQDLMLWDLNFLDLNTGWQDSDRDAVRVATTGIVQALVNDGRLVQNQVSVAPTIENQGGILKPPQVYYHTTLEKIFNGFQYSGDIFDNDIYKKLVIPLSVIYNDPAFLEAKAFLAAVPGVFPDTQIIVNTTETVLFNRNIKQGSDNFWNGSEYVVLNTDTPLRYFRLNFYVDLTIEVTGGTVDIVVEATGYTDEETLNVGTGTYSLVLEVGVGLQDGDIVRVRIRTNSGTPTTEIKSGQFYTVNVTGTEGQEFLPSIIEEYIYFNKLFPKITMLDFIKDFCVRFNVQITQIDNTLQVNTLNSILDDRSGPDWTTKRDKGLDRIRYAFSTYGKTNSLKSPTDDFTPDLTDDYGDGKFTIPNENLRDSFNIYTSFFAVTQMINTFGVFMLNMNLVPNLANFGRMPGKRLFFVREQYDFEPPVLYDAIDRSDYLVGYYFDPNQDYDLSYQFFIDNFHQKFIDRCLRRVRLVEREYNLSDLDIFKFNQQVPIRDNGERFLVTKISNRVSKKVVKVELLKIESNPENFFTSGDENIISGNLVNFLQILGDAVPPENDIEMQLFEDITGNPTWQTTFDNGVDTPSALTVLGNLSFNDGTMNSGASIDADVLKTNNDGFGTTGFPMNTGYVEWMLNGVRVNTKTFNTASSSAAQVLNYTYTGIVYGDTLRVNVFEDGSTP